MLTFESERGLEWLSNSAWPLWLAYGVDWQRRGFNESLTLDTLESLATFRRLRVVARQTYVFSIAHTFGIARAGEAVELGVEFLLGRARHPDGGFAWRFDLEGRAIDLTRDLYDHAFVLLALASASSVLPAGPLQHEARALQSFLEAEFLHKRGGFVESLPEKLPRRQNPHMHLLEALLAAAEAFQDDSFVKMAAGIVELFLDRFFDPAAGALPEYFQDDLSPVLQDGRYIVEPGHHCEWIWLLEWFSRLALDAGLPARPTRVVSERLQKFVDSHGVHPADNVLFDGVWNNGEIQSAGSRLWPQTERLKAELRRADANPRRVSAAYAALEAYFTQTPRGLWHERRDADGRFTAEPAPASSLYHLTCAIRDLAERTPAPAQ